MSVRKVLIISYVWPPMDGVGLMRAFKFAKYLPAFGWQPLILTVKYKMSGEGAGEQSLPGVRVFRTGYRDLLEDLRGLFGRKNTVCCGSSSQQVSRNLSSGKARKPSLMRELIMMPDDQAGWYGYGSSEAEKIATEERVDAVFSTSPPETAHLIARKVRKDCGIPWVADLRDLWAEDHFRQRPFIKNKILGVMERYVLKDADAVVTVSEPWANTLRRSMPGMSDRVRVIENAYDDEDMKQFPRPFNDKLTIVYTGKIHSERQPLGTLFAAVRSLVTSSRIDRSKIAIRFYALGYDKPDIEAMARSYGLDGIVQDLGKIGYEKSIEVQRTADALLFVQWQGKGSEGWYSAKIYDYIGSRRPIMALAVRGGIIDDLLKRTMSGTIVSTEDETREALARMYDEYLERGTAAYMGIETEIAKLSRRLRAKELAGLLDSIVEKREV